MGMSLSEHVFKIFQRKIFNTCSDKLIYSEDGDGDLPFKVFDRAAKKRPRWAGVFVLDVFKLNILKISLLPGTLFRGTNNHNNAKSTFHSYFLPLCPCGTGPNRE